MIKYIIPNLHILMIALNNKLLDINYMYDFQIIRIYDHHVIIKDSDMSFSPCIKKCVICNNMKPYMYHKYSNNTRLNFIDYIQNGFSPLCHVILLEDGNIRLSSERTILLYEIIKDKTPAKIQYLNGDHTIYFGYNHNFASIRTYVQMWYIVINQIKNNNIDTNMFDYVFHNTNRFKSWVDASIKFAYEYADNEYIKKSKNYDQIINNI